MVKGKNVKTMKRRAWWWNSERTKAMRTLINESNGWAMSKDRNNNECEGRSYKEIMQRDVEVVKKKI